MQPHWYLSAESWRGSPDSFRRPTSAPPYFFFSRISPASCKLLGASWGQRDWDLSSGNRFTPPSPLLFWLAFLLQLCFSLPRLPPSLRRSLIPVPICSAEPSRWREAEANVTLPFTLCRTVLGRRPSVCFESGRVIELKEKPPGFLYIYLYLYIYVFNVNRWIDGYSHRKWISFGCRFLRV